MTFDSKPPQSLDPTLAPVARFDPGLLPEALRERVEDVAERMQCPPDFVAVALMVTAGSALGRKLTLRPREHDPWAEVPNVWGGCVGLPGFQKTPAMRAGTQSLERLQKEALDEHEKALATHNEQTRVYEALAKSTKRRLDKAAKDGDRAAVEATQREAAADLGQSPEAPLARRWITHDITGPMLVALCGENPGGILQICDELARLFASLEKPSNEDARGIYLEGWGGDGAFHTDRIGRGSTHSDGLCVGVLGTIQPGPLMKHVRDALGGAAGADGLLQRFQFLVWPDPPAEYRVVDRPENIAARDRADAAIRKLATLDPATVGADMDEHGLPYVRFTADARDTFNAWDVETMNRVRSTPRRGGRVPPEVEALGSHLSKYKKVVCSVALVSYVVDGGEGPVGVEHVERGIGWARYLETHARRIYGSGADAALMGARRIVEGVQEGKLSSPLVVRDIVRMKWSGLAKTDDVRAALEELERRGWVQRREVPTDGRPREEYVLNPAGLGADGVPALAAPADAPTEGDTTLAGDGAPQLLAPSVGGSGLSLVGVPCPAGRASTAGDGSPGVSSGASLAPPTDKDEPFWHDEPGL